jgi:hypothetical protein
MSYYKKFIFPFKYFLCIDVDAQGFIEIRFYYCEYMYVTSYPSTSLRYTIRRQKDSKKPTID